MKLRDFLKDRAGAYVIYGAAYLILLLFMAAFRMPMSLLLIVSLILLAAVAAAELWELMRKKECYDKLASCIDELDNKYLISEMIEEPSFYEGRLFYEVLHRAGKSMCENISEYRTSSEDFREYIELWVHEVKLPVASMELMCHNDGSTRYTEQLRRIDTCIENVLYYARSGSAEKDYVIKETSLGRVFADTAVKYRSELRERGVEITATGLDVSVMTDSKWLEYILGQLISNSMKYFSPDRAPVIEVSAQELPDRTELHFRDNGIGIPESDLPYIFEKSFTGENGRTHGRSTGMGLYIVKKLCDRLGHRASAESLKGEYTGITLSFGRNDHNKFGD